MRRDEFGFTGWTPYRILGPRGPPRLRPLARSGNHLQPALHLWVSRSWRTHLLPHLPSSRQRGPWSVPFCRWLPDRSRGRGYTPPNSRSALGRLAAEGRSLSSAPPESMPWPWAARHHSARERSVALSGAASAHGACARLAFGPALAVLASCNCDQLDSLKCGVIPAALTRGVIPGYRRYGAPVWRDVCLLRCHHLPKLLPACSAII